MRFNQRWVVIAALASGASLLGVAVWKVCDKHVAIGATSKQAANNHALPNPKQFNQPLLAELDIPGICAPQLLPAGTVNLKDEEVVIGVVVGGLSRAYLRKAFDGHEHHVVNDLVGIAPISVTHYKLARCTRVLTHQAGVEQPLGIRIGGWNREYGMMMVIVNEQRYLQLSPDIPLLDVPYSEVTWGEWRREHPDSLIYLGSSLDS